MTPEQVAAYVNAQATAAHIEAAGMLAENQERAIYNRPPAFTQDSFLLLLDRYQLHHNSIMSMYREANS